MGTLGFIKKNLNQTLVYWGNPSDDGYGGYDFDAPVEIAGRCEHTAVMVVVNEGEEVVNRAFVYLDQEVDKGGYLYLGTLDDAAMGSSLQPDTTEGSMRILAFEKIPQLSGSKFVYKAYVNRD